MTRIAVAQAAPRAFDAEESLRRACQWIERAASERAELVVLPEAFLSGYPKGMDFGARVGTRSDAGRELYRRYHASAVDVPGPAVDTLAALARRCEIAVVIGVVERDGGTLYCTALTLGADGSLVRRHRKLVPTGVERLIWGSGDGSTMQVADLPIGRVGTAVCWENYMPLYRTHLYSQGVEFYCAPTVDDRDSWVSSMRHIAVEGRCFVLAACQFVTRTDLRGALDASPVVDPSAIMIRGGSCIVDPFGTLLSGPVYDCEELLTADIDLDATLRGKFDLDVVGHYARDDVFQLVVDERPTDDEPPPP